VVDGVRADQPNFNSLMASKRPGDQLHMDVVSGKETKSVTVTLNTKYEKSFSITAMAHPDALQAAIYKSWLR